LKWLVETGKRGEESDFECAREFLRQAGLRRNDEKRSHRTHIASTKHTFASGVAKEANVGRFGGETSDGREDDAMARRLLVHRKRYRALARLVELYGSLETLEELGMQRQRGQGIGTRGDYKSIEALYKVAR